MPGEVEGQRKKEEHGTSHSFAYPKHRRYMSNFTIILSKPPTAFKKEKKKSHNTFQSQKQCVWPELLFPPLAWIIKSLLCVFNPS